MFDRGGLSVFLCVSLTILVTEDRVPDRCSADRLRVNQRRSRALVEITVVQIQGPLAVDNRLDGG